MELKLYSECSLLYHLPSMLYIITLSISLASFDPNIINLVREGLKYSYEERYEKAESTFNMVIEKYPGSPVGYFFKGALYDYYMLDFSVDSKESLFYSLMDSTIKKAREFSNDDSSKAWAYFFMGSAYGYEAMREGRKRKFLTAIPHGIKALKYLKKSVNLKPDLYDAYLGIGIFEFAMAELPKFIKWLAAGNVTKEEALEKMELAATKGYFARELAMDALAWTESYLGNTKRGLELSKQLLEKYPESRSFRWTLAYSQRRAGKWKDALHTYLEILSLSLRDQKDFPYAIGIILYWIGRLYYYQGMWDEALIWIDTGIQIAENEPDEKRRESLLKDLEMLKERVLRGIRRAKGPELPDILRKLR